MAISHASTTRTIKHGHRAPLNTEVENPATAISATMDAANGRKQWTILLGTSDREYGFDIAADSNSNIYVTGLSDGDLAGNNNMGGSDIFVWKIVERIVGVMPLIPLLLDD